MKYFGTDQVIRVGDPIRYAGAPGSIVFIVDEDSYSGGRYTRENWAYLGKGLGVELQDGNLFCLPSADEEEDLEPAGR